MHKRFYCSVVVWMGWSRQNWLWLWGTLKVKVPCSGNAHEAKDMESNGECFEMSLRCATWTRNAPGRSPAHMQGLSRSNLLFNSISKLFSFCTTWFFYFSCWYFLRTSLYPFLASIRCGLWRFSEKRLPPTLERVWWISHPGQWLQFWFCIIFFLSRRLVGHSVKVHLISWWLRLLLVTM